VLLLIDNYDSFTWNLVQRFSEIDPGLRIEVVRNDAIDIAGAEALAPTHLVISPGPCTPKEAGISGALLSHFRGRIPALGVCLGHQAIGDIHGMTVRRNDIAVHGKTSLVEHDGRGLFAGLPNPFVATRYHSLVIDPATVHPDFEVTARTERGEIMGIRWKAPAGAAPLEGVPVAALVGVAHAVDLVAGARLEEAQRIGDAIAREAIHNQTALIAQNDFFARRVKIQQATIGQHEGNQKRHGLGGGIDID
jgi:anthranilate synthase/aminodeoxychorismate synthase-like glutamine amidotransferase